MERLKAPYATDAEYVDVKYFARGSSNQLQHKFSIFSSVCVCVWERVIERERELLTRKQPINVMFCCRSPFGGIRLLSIWFCCKPLKAPPSTHTHTPMPKWWLISSPSWKWKQTHWDVKWRLYVVVLILRGLNFFFFTCFFCICALSAPSRVFYVYHRE